MKLIFKFNLAFIGIFLIGLGNGAYIFNRVLEQNARDEVLHTARLMIEAAVATHSYTSKQVKPLLETQMKYTFLPQSVPQYSAAEVSYNLQKKFPDYTFKQAVLNPTNPRNRAIDWEIDIIKQFQADPGRQELIGEHGQDKDRLLYVAWPIQINDSACLACHSTADAAPKTMVAHYGPENGFGWQFNEVVGVQMVTVPTNVAHERASGAFRTFMLSLTGVFLFIGIGLNLLLQELVIQPVGELSQMAEQVSKGNLDAPDFDVRTKDEIGMLADSLNRMKKSLVEAMKMLGG